MSGTQKSKEQTASESRTAETNGGRGIEGVASERRQSGEGASERQASGGHGYHTENIQEKDNIDPLAVVIFFTN